MKIKKNKYIQYYYKNKNFIKSQNTFKQMQ